MIYRIALMALLAASPALSDVWSFATPSNNIHCSVGEGFEGSDIQCIIYQKNTGPIQPWPAGCNGAWGHVFFMWDRGPVELVCVNIGSGGGQAQDVAPYGVTGEFGGFTCHSSRKGLECRNLDGHGFFLSRRKQQIF